MNTKSFIQIILKKDFYRVKKNIYITLKIYISKNRIKIHLKTILINIYLNLLLVIFNKHTNDTLTYLQIE